MSLFRYRFIVADGEEKSGKITAKTKEAAREKLAKAHKIVEWRNISEIAVPKTPPSKPEVVITPPAAKAKPSTKLEKLLYLQSNECFFCGRVLKKEEASVEHLLPKSKGGSNDDGNVVACCVTLNRTFGSMDLKEKVRVILAKAGNFTCPKA